MLRSDAFAISIKLNISILSVNVHHFDNDPTYWTHCSRSYKATYISYHTVIPEPILKHHRTRTNIEASSRWEVVTKTSQILCNMTALFFLVSTQSWKQLNLVGNLYLDGIPKFGRAELTCWRRKQKIRCKNHIQPLQTNMERCNSKVFV